MDMQKKALLLAGLIVGAAALTGCSAIAKPMATPTPMAALQQTAQPATAQPSPMETAGAQATQQTDETPKRMTLLIGGEEADADAIFEQEKLLLPLVETAENLGWKMDEEQTEEDAQTKRVITLEKDESRITVSWTVSDNTAKNISWQKDGCSSKISAMKLTYAFNI